MGFQVVTGMALSLVLHKNIFVSERILLRCGKIKCDKYFPPYIRLFEPKCFHKCEEPNFIGIFRTA
jgi:hypothetical protein